MNCTRDIETPNCGAEVLDDIRIYDRALSPEEVAELALWLASPKASFVSGAVYDIDGAIGSRLHDLI